MLQSIFDALMSFFDIVSSLISFVVQIVSDLIYLVTHLSEIPSAISGATFLFPPVLAGVFLTCVGVYIVLRIIGRSE